MVFIFLLSCHARKRKDLDESKCKWHEKSVNNATSTISSMENPFDGDQVELINISSGVVGDVADDILHAEKLGEDQLAKFCQPNLFTHNPDIFRNIKKNKFRTFSSDSDSKE